MSDARRRNCVSLGRFVSGMLWLIVFFYFVCSRVTMSVRPIRHPRDAEETVQALDKCRFLHPLKQTVASFLPLVISLAVNTDQPHSWDVVSRVLSRFRLEEGNSFDAFVGRTQATTLSAFSDPSGSLPSSFAENTIAFDYHCPHVRPVPNRRRFENPNLGPCVTFSIECLPIPPSTASSIAPMLPPFTYNLGETSLHLLRRMGGPDLRTRSPGGALLHGGIAPSFSW